MTDIELNLALKEVIILLNENLDWTYKKAIEKAKENILNENIS